MNVDFNSSVFDQSTWSSLIAQPWRLDHSELGHSATRHSDLGARHLALGFGHSMTQHSDSGAHHSTSTTQSSTTRQSNSGAQYSIEWSSSEWSRSSAKCRAPEFESQSCTEPSCLICEYDLHASNVRSVKAKFA